MKSIELRRGIRFVSYAVLATASAACEPTIIFGAPPGQGGQAGQDGGMDDGGVAGAGGAGGEAGSAGAGGSGGSGGGTSSSGGSTSSSTGSSSSSTGSSSSSTSSSSSSTGSSSSSTGSSSSSTGSSSSSTGSSSSSTGSSSSSTGSSSSSTGSTSSSTGSSSSSSGGGAGGAGGSGGSGECTDGQTQPCYSGPVGTENVGACKGGVETCVNGQWSTCTGEVIPSSETCDSIDNDCNGVVDDGNPGGGAACNTGQPGLCATGTAMCTSGTIVCTANNAGNPETCDGIDNDCNGVVDEGNPGGGAACNTGLLGACATGTSACSVGTIVCNANNAPGVEICDGIDNDCDGVIDNGNPGGGVPCGVQLGGCGERTVCSNGTLVCRGTFVAPLGIGAPGNPGTQAQPVSTIAEAQALAVAMGNGTDICVCDPPTAGETQYVENITMVEGVSIFGGYNCSNWSRDIAAYPTAIRGTTAQAVTFQNGTTDDTTLDGMNAYGPDASGGATGSRAILVWNASATLQDVIAIGGKAQYSSGLSAGASMTNTYHVNIIRGRYEAQGVYNITSSQTSVILNNVTGILTDVAIGGNVNNGAEVDYSIGLHCIACGATSITGGAITGGNVLGSTTGVRISGDVAGFSITGTDILGGTSTSPYDDSVGLNFYECIGSPVLTNVTISGGASPHSAYGIRSNGVQCAPKLVGAHVTGCSNLTPVTPFCVGIECYDGAACGAKDSVILGSTGSAANRALRCWSGACSLFSGNTIAAGPSASNNQDVKMAVQVSGANPEFRDNDISTGVCPSSSLNKSVTTASFENSQSVLTNNVFHELGCNKTDLQVVRLDAGAAVMMHNNTIQFATCTGCGVKRGLVLVSSTGANVRNNIFVNAGVSDFANGFGVYETNATSNLLSFENNALWMPNGGTLYMANGTTPLLLAAINALQGHAANIDADPLLDATYHLLPGSPCRNAGKTVTMPLVDFDGDARPQEMSFDIGADEYVP